MRAFKTSGLFPPREPKYDLINSLKGTYSEIELEIGAGHGHHSIELAKSQPQKLIIGVERTRNKFLSFQKNLSSNPLSNLIAIHADVIPWLVFLDKQITFSKIWILYPNPEVKSKNRRWIRAPFFSELIKRMTSNGEIEFATNLAEYANDLKEKSSTIWNLTPKMKTYTGPARTQFEKKYLEREQVCYQILLT